mgnify:CR=1 FL=1
MHRIFATDIEKLTLPREVDPPRRYDPMIGHGRQ